MALLAIPLRLNCGATGYSHRDLCRAGAAAVLFRLSHFLPPLVWYQSGTVRTAWRGCAPGFGAATEKTPTPKSLRRSLFIPGARAMITPFRVPIGKAHI